MGVVSGILLTDTHSGTKKVHAGGLTIGGEMLSVSYQTLLRGELDQ